MAEHRPTLGSRLCAWRRPGAPLRCCCGRPWPCLLRDDDGRIPDGDQVPMDFIQRGRDVYRLNRGQGAQ